MHFSLRKGVFFLVRIIATVILSWAVFSGISPETAQAAGTLYEIISEQAPEYLSKLENTVSKEHVKDFVDALDAALRGRAFSDEDALKGAAIAAILNLAGQDQNHRAVLDAIIKTFGSEISQIAGGDYSGFEPLYNAVKKKYLVSSAPGTGGAPLPAKEQQMVAPLTPKEVIARFTGEELTPEEAARALAAELALSAERQLSVDYRSDLSVALKKIFAAAGRIDPALFAIAGDERAVVVSVPGEVLKSKLEQIQTLQAVLEEGLQKAGLAGMAAGVPKRIILPAASGLNSPIISVRFPADGVKEVIDSGVELVVQTHLAAVAFPPASRPAGGSGAVVLELKIEVLENSSASRISDGASPEGGAWRLHPVGRPLSIKLNVSGGNAGGKDFAAPIEITFPYEKSKVADPDLLAVYNFNESREEWKYAGGWVDQSECTIAVKTLRLGIYAVMEYRGDFSDLAGHWARRNVRLMAAKQLVSGTGRDTFSPDKEITRAEFAVILARMLGLAPDPAGAARFADVEADAWYRGMVGAAAKAGLVAGVGPAVFGPAEPVTREQMAVMIARLLAKQKGLTIDENEAGDLLAAFPDGASVSFWARAGVALMSKENIMKGREGQGFVPDGWATRAEATVVLSRVLKKYFSGPEI